MRIESDSMGTIEVPDNVYWGAQTARSLIHFKIGEDRMPPELIVAIGVRWLAAGPRCGIGELVLPANEPGSSIMPGKVNPTQCEAVTMVAVQVHGNNAAIAFAGSQGNFELNVFKTILAYNFLHSVRLLADVSRSFSKYCVEGLEVNRKRIDYYVNRSLMLVTALSPVIGYDKCAKLAHYAQENDLSLREANQKLGFVSDDQFQKVVRPEAMTKPEESTARKANS